MSEANEVEKYVRQYGEAYRTMIVDAILFKNELVRDLKLKNFDTDFYIADLIEHDAIKYWKNS